MRKSREVKTNIRHEMAAWLRKCRRDKNPNLWRFFFEIAAPFLLIMLLIVLLTSLIAAILTMAMP